jgi:hypothetical protein
MNDKRLSTTSKALLAAKAYDQLEGCSTRGSRSDLAGTPPCCRRREAAKLGGVSPSVLGIVLRVRLSDKFSYLYGEMTSGRLDVWQADKIMRPAAYGKKSTKKISRLSPAIRVRRIGNDSVEMAINKVAAAVIRSHEYVAIGFDKQASAFSFTPCSVVDSNVKFYQGEVGETLKCWPAEALSDLFLKRPSAKRYVCVVTDGVLSFAVKDRDLW